jgi:hypothetical protein
MTTDPPTSAAMHAELDGINAVAANPDLTVTPFTTERRRAFVSSETALIWLAGDVDALRDALGLSVADLAVATGLDVADLGPILAGEQLAHGKVLGACLVALGRAVQRGA